MNKPYTEKLNSEDLERINKIICKPTENNVFMDHVKAGIKTEEEIYRLFYYWVKEALTYTHEPLEIIKGGKEKLEVALEYLKENERER